MSGKQRRVNFPTMAETTGGIMRNPEAASNRTGKVYATPALIPDGDSMSPGTGPFVKSFFKPIITPRAKKPKFIEPASGVPTKLINPYGYWRAQDKVDREGRPITLWYYYEIGDGPFSYSKFGDPVPGIFWVRRANAPKQPPASSYSNYDPNAMRPKVAKGTGIRVERQGGIPTNTTDVSATSGDDSDASSFAGVLTGRNKVLKKKKPSKSSGAESDASTGKGSKTKPPNSTDPKKQDKPAKPRDNLKDMQKRPPQARSMLASDDPETMYGETVTMDRKDVYESTKTFWPTRHFSMHYAAVDAHWHDSDEVDVRMNLNFGLDPKFKDNQDFFAWLLKRGYIMCNSMVAEATCQDRNEELSNACRVCALAMYKNGARDSSWSLDSQTTVWEAAINVYNPQYDPSVNDTIKAKDEAISTLSSQVAELTAIVSQQSQQQAALLKQLQELQAKNTAAESWSANVVTPAQSTSVVTQQTPPVNVVKEQRPPPSTKSGAPKSSSAAPVVVGDTTNLFGSIASSNSFQPSQSLDITKINPTKLG